MNQPLQSSSNVPCPRQNRWHPLLCPGSPLSPPGWDSSCAWPLSQASLSSQVQPGPDSLRSKSPVASSTLCELEVLGESLPASHFPSVSVFCLRFWGALLVLAGPGCGPHPSPGRVLYLVAFFRRAASAKPVMGTGLTPRGKGSPRMAGCPGEGRKQRSFLTSRRERGAGRSGDICSRDFHTPLPRPQEPLVLTSCPSPGTNGQEGRGLEQGPTSALLAWRTPDCFLPCRLIHAEEQRCQRIPLLRNFSDGGDPVIHDLPPPSFLTKPCPCSHGSRTKGNGREEQMSNASPVFLCPGLRSTNGDCPLLRPLLLSCCHFPKEISPEHSPSLRAWTRGSMGNGTSR